MTSKFSDNPPAEYPYYYKDNPLQHFTNNNYTREEKIEITIQLEADYKAGMLSVANCRWIYNNSRYGSFTATRIMDDMMKKNIIKKNPISNDKRLFHKERSKFDW